MNRTNARKLILSNGLVASVPLFIWMVTSGLDVATVYGATRLIPYTYDRGSFNITDLSIKEGDYSTDIIGFIQNVDPDLRTIKGVSLHIEMYDRNNHLIDIAESGYSSSLPSYFLPQDKSAFKIPIDKNSELDHLHIQILAQDWGTSNTYPDQNISTVGNYSSDRPYIGIIGLSLTPDLSKQIGLNQTKGFLLTSITKGSPADKTGLRAGTNTTTINGRDVNVGGDIILKIDNQSVFKIEDIMAYVSQKHPGDTVHLTILRDNIIREPDLILGQMPSQPTSQNDGNKNREQLYNECVNVAGKSLCDFLFKR
ncbi:MAG: PDZ domain-containing protein [Thaumarchaeota archaeon]|nr:MAG: PDZ domain-containing protein [Nitrososphaerota archaeon]